MINKKIYIEKDRITITDKNGLVLHMSGRNQNYNLVILSNEEKNKKGSALNCGHQDTCDKYACRRKEIPHVCFDAVGPIAW